MTVKTRALGLRSGRTGVNACKFLIFELRFSIGGRRKFDIGNYIAGLEAGVPTNTREASPDGKRRFGRRGFAGLSGCEAIKRTGCYRVITGSNRLFPHISTQVVDFPHLGIVRVFWGGLKYDDLSCDRPRRIMIWIRRVIKRNASHSAVDTGPTFATLGPSIFAVNHQKQRDEQELNYGKSI